MRTDPCKQCNSFDFYERGKFSYCRPCHSEAQKRYIQNKRMGIKPETKGGPSKLLSQLLAKSAPLKPVCKHGHPLSGDNVRQDTQRRNDILRRCRTCERNAKRVSYGLQPEPAPLRLTDLLE